MQGGVPLPWYATQYATSPRVLATPDAASVWDATKRDADGVVNDAHVDECGEYLTRRGADDPSTRCA